MANVQDRLAISRLINRFGFGPKPGEYAALLAKGLPAAQAKLLTPPATDVGLSTIAEPDFPDRGPFPTAGTPARTAFAAAMQSDRLNLELWWLDRMVLADHALTERLTWFWHGHWATSMGKVEYARPMKMQNDTLRANALGNFNQMAQVMVIDPALMFWLDAGANVKQSPNENLARELMELFVLGVGRYTEDDVRGVSRSLTGYNVSRSASTFTFNPNRHDATSFPILGTAGTWDAASIIKFLVARSDNQKFITDRLWFRMMSTALPTPSDVGNAFANREILPAVQKMATYVTSTDPLMSQVKSPVEWAVAACRALKVTPSKVQNRAQIINYLDKLGQYPFNPPNVGGWPFDEAWLNIASTQYRIGFAGNLIAQGDLSPIAGLSGLTMENAIADWLGIPE
ncbi:MAG: DUF1800 family protein, partial [Actinomycetes bacterium]